MHASPCLCSARLSEPGIKCVACIKNHRDFDRGTDYAHFAKYCCTYVCVTSLFYPGDETLRVYRHAYQIHKDFESSCNLPAPSNSWAQRQAARSSLPTRRMHRLRHIPNSRLLPKIGIPQWIKLSELVHDNTESFTHTNAILYGLGNKWWAMPVMPFRQHVGLLTKCFTKCSHNFWVRFTICKCISPETASLGDVRICLYRHPTVGKNYVYLVSV